MAILSVLDISIEDIMESIASHKYTPYDENGDLSKRFKDIKAAWVLNYRRPDLEEINKLRYGIMQRQDLNSDEQKKV